MEDYGRLVTLLSVIQLLSLVMDFGAKTSLITFFRPNANQGGRGEVLGSVLLINAGAGLVVSTFIFVTFPYLLPRLIGISSSMRYILLAAIVAYLQSLNATLLSYYRITDAPRLFAIASVSTALLNLAFVLLFVRVLRFGVTGVLSAIALSLCITTIPIVLIILKHVGCHASVSWTIRLLRFGAPLVLSGGGELLADTFPLLFLASLAGLNAAGVYGLAMKLSTVTLTLLILPFTMAFEPYVVLNAENGNIGRRISSALSMALLLFALLAFGIVVAGPQVIAFMAPPAYRWAQTLLFVILPAMAFRTLYYGCEPLLHLKHKSLLKGCSVLLCVLTMSCLYPLAVPRWGALGAATVYALSLASYSIFLAVISFRLWSIFTGGRRFLIAGLLLTSLLAVAYLLPAKPAIAHYSCAAIIGLATLYLITRAGLLTGDESAVLGAAVQRFRSVLPSWGN